MKKLALALAVTVVGATGALAQDTIIRREGPYGSRTVIQRDADDDIGVRRRRLAPDADVVVRRRRFEPDADVVVRRRGFAPDADVVVRRGGPRCRTIVVRRENFRGDTVIRRIRRCD